LASVGLWDRALFQPCELLTVFIDSSEVSGTEGFSIRHSAVNTETPMIEIVKASETTTTASITTTEMLTASDALHVIGLSLLALSMLWGVMRSG
ncbi:hypothetical protein PFISCL1PPCAC_3175, partial [Pristionchus fissidentatus]